MLQALRCPTCTAPIAFAPGQTTATCRYCGAEVRDVASPPAARPGPAKGALAEGLSIRPPSGALVPLVAAGAALPIAHEQRLASSRDGQPSLTCVLVAGADPGREVARLEVSLRPAPRGVAVAGLAVRIDAAGDAFVSLTGEDGYAEARFGLRVA